MREITERDLELLATGAWILGAGGGGDPYHALLAMKTVSYTHLTLPTILLV